jgi:2'-5' RNA ligase
MGRSALVVLVPAAEPAVGELRSRLDPISTRGVPAHITVLFPFVPADSLDDGVRAAVAEVVAGFPPFDAALTHPAWFGDQVLYLAPEPAGPFRALTEAVAARFPDFPPYEGAFDEVIPHLTVGDGAARAVLEEAMAGLGPQLPIPVRVTGVHLLTEGVSGSWQVNAEFPLSSSG